MTNEMDTETYTRAFHSETDARHWVINHLDLSKNWHINKTVKPLTPDEIRILQLNSIFNS